MAKPRQIAAGYNVQIAVDDKHKLIVASEVVNEGNDTGQLCAVAEAAKAALGAERLTVVADTGYYNGETLKACEDAAISAYVPPPDRGQRLKAQAGSALRISAKDATADVYGCPAGADCGRCRGKSVRPVARWRDPLRQSSIGLSRVSATRTLSDRQGPAARDRTLDG